MSGKSSITFRLNVMRSNRVLRASEDGIVFDGHSTKFKSVLEVAKFCAAIENSSQCFATEKSRNAHTCKTSTSDFTCKIETLENWAGSWLEARTYRLTQIKNSKPQKYVVMKRVNLYYDSRKILHQNSYFSDSAKEDTHNQATVSCGASRRCSGK